MPTKTLFRFGFCVVFISCTACGPLVPLSYQKEILNDPLGQTIETKEATVFLEYMGTQYYYYIFDLEVINHSPSEIFIAPQFMSYYASPKPFKPLYNPTDDVHMLSFPNSALTLKRQFANSPEATRKIYRQKVQSKEGGAILFALIGAAIIIYDAAKDGDDSHKETFTKKDRNESIGRDILVNVALAASDVAQVEAEDAKVESQYIPYELFPECRIKSGASVRGKIFLPKESFRYSRVVVPVGNTDYVFDFRRQGAKPIQSQSQHHPSVDAQRK